jgi:Domain of unknown function (DUF4160)
MPTIAWFYGIAICMYYDDHNPPHFHAFYGEYEAKVAIDTGEIMEGKLPHRAMRLVREWCLERKPALMNNWERARSGKQLERLSGLDAD